MRKNMKGAYHNLHITQMQNTSEVSQFILLGLTDAPELQVPLFIIFTLIYLTTLLGNLGMIVLILLDSRLHTPMYIFLSNLSLVDCVYASAVTPKVIEGFLIEHKIMYNECATQMFFFIAFAIIEVFLLASMAFDRYVAVCKPLHYSTTMTTTKCTLLIAGSYISGLLQSSIHVAFTFHLSFCQSNVINHFFCDIPPLLAISCSDINNNEIILFTLAGFNVTLTILVILNSYLLIFAAILRMRSAEGRKKAVSTCTSHLTTVSIFYGTIIFMYLQPSSSHSMGTDKVASVFYTMIIPMLNPLVYSLRNKDVKNAFKKINRNMSQGNQTTISEFINQAEKQKLIFMLFLSMYLVSVVGNGLIILAIGLDIHLHTPMYLFLDDLSFDDIFLLFYLSPKNADEYSDPKAIHLL
ncbi:hypothetical protein STEG23_029255 [Scotinomys teguina]